MEKFMDNKSWDGLAADYDKSVEDNQNPLIINYLKKEIEILNTLCQKHSDSHKNFSIIDMGACPNSTQVLEKCYHKLHNCRLHSLHFPI